MIDSLSILLPTYNCDCTQLVNALHKQCEGIDNLNYEIVVADDGSSIKSFIEHNQVITTLSNTRYIVRNFNSGRSAIRNFLAQEAKNKWLLFIDGDLGLNLNTFIKKYISSKGDIVVGGITIEGNHPDNLRWKYEKACEEAHSVEKRKINKLELHTNFLIRKTDIQKYPFDERFHKYGYEDVLLGKKLCEAGLEVEHIDNPIVFSKYESNEHYLQKCQEALSTLFEFKDELEGYSRIITLTDKLKKLRLLPILNISYQLINKVLISMIISNKPSIYAFNIYKMLYYSHLTYQNVKK